MRHPIESKDLMVSLTEGEEPAASSGSLLGGSAPEEFLREVTATLTAFLEDEPRVRGLDTGEAPSAH